MVALVRDLTINNVSLVGVGGFGTIRMMNGSVMLNSVSFVILGIRSVSLVGMSGFSSTWMNNSSVVLNNVSSIVVTGFSFVGVNLVSSVFGSGRVVFFVDGTVRIVLFSFMMSIHG